LAAGETVGYWGNVGPTGLRRLRQVLRAGGVIAGTGEAAYVSWCEPDAGVSERAPGPAGLAVVPSPWPHQAAAVDAVAAAIAAGGVCQVAMASGSGKTNVALWAARHMGCRSVLVLVPALGLVEQVSAVWRRLWPEARQLGFCSDTGGVRSALNLAATTDPADVASFLAAPGPAVLISTYQSSPALATAALAGLDWDVIIADEAHHVAGAADKAYAAVLRGEIPARRVLYLTATPRSYARAGGDVTVVGMDDPAFGPRVFDFGLDAAIDAAVVADYRIVVAAVEAEVFQAVAARPEMAGIDPHLLAGAIAVVRAISEMGLNSCVSFHSRVERARTFASLIGPVAEALGEARPAGPGWSGYVHGGASVHIRGRLLARLGDPGSWGVLANARALGEGVDLPTLDCVAIVDPRNSEVDVLQAVGRALRRPGGPGGEKVGTIILPVLLTGPVDDADPLAAVDARGLDVVAGVMSAMRAHDASLGRRLDHSRRQGGRAAAWPEGLARARGMAALAFFKSRLHMQVPGGATGQLAGALALQMVRDTTAAWDEALGRLRAWVEDHGDAAVAQGTKVAAPDLAAGTFALGAWCTVQRTLHRRGLLAAERAAELDALPGWSWEPRAERWWTSFDALADYVSQHGAYPAQKPEMLWRGVRVGQFVNTSRLGYGVDGWLRAYPDRVAALESLPGWVWNERHAAWEDHYVLLADFAARHGHASPGIHDVVDGFNLGRWVQKERAAIREGRRSVERAARLRALPGWVDHTRDAAWEHGYARLVAWAAANGEIPPQTWVCEDGFTLGGWVCTQRERRRRGRLDASRAARLETVPGWAWDPIGDTWAAGLEALRRYSNREGTAEVPGGWVDASGFPLGSWCGTQRVNRDRMPAERAAALEAVPGWTWSVPATRFAEKLAALADYAAGGAGCDPAPREVHHGVHVGAFVARVRQLHSAGRLSDEQVAALESLAGWTWSPPPSAQDMWQSAWDQAYAQLEGWASTHGHARPPGDLVVNGRRLGAWVVKQRSRRAAMPADRARRLEALPGWQWAAPR
jgi:superfamily II DNA or RNA helicase